MKKYLAGLLTGLILTTTTFTFAANPIKLLVNGKEVQSDVPPQVINGRTMVPARFLAEALGAKVEWDAANSAVVVTTNSPSVKQGISEGYYTGRQIFTAVTKKHPNAKVTGLGSSNVLNYDGADYTLPLKVIDNQNYYFPIPLFDAGIITPDDLDSV